MTPAIREGFFSLDTLCLLWGTLWGFLPNTPQGSKCEKVTPKEDKQCPKTEGQRAKEICSAVAELNPSKPLLRSSEAVTPRLSVTANTRVNHCGSAQHSCQRTL